MSSETKKVPSGLVSTFRVLSVIARILFFPVLVLSVLMIGTFSATSSVNKVNNARISAEHSEQVQVKAGWGYYIIELKSESGIVSVAYGKDVEGELSASDWVLYYDILENSEQTMLYRFGFTPIWEVGEIDGESVYYIVSDAKNQVPYENIIAVETESIPAVFKFVLSNFSQFTDLMFFGLIPMLLILLVFLFDSIIYVKTKNVTITRKDTSRREEANIKYFEELKRTYTPAKPEEYEQKVDGAVDARASIKPPKPPKPPKKARGKVEQPTRPEAYIPAKPIPASDMTQNAEEKIDDKAPVPVRPAAPPPPPPPPPPSKRPQKKS